MKGIILAGGTGSRLFPITIPVCKQLLPVFDKPMIYYPLSLLVEAGIKDIMIICRPSDLAAYTKLFGDGSTFGLNIVYRIQEKPKGIADAFIIANQWIGDENVCLALGDNLFWGTNVAEFIRFADYNATFGKATIFGYEVSNPYIYGVATFTSDSEYEGFRVTSLEEKPTNPRSNYAVPGLYIYPPNVKEVVKKLELSGRGELEITDLSKLYMKDKALRIELLPSDSTWLDMGTTESLYEASVSVATIQKRTGKYIGCFEEMAYYNQFMTDEQLYQRIMELGTHTPYGHYLNTLLVRKGIHF